MNLCWILILASINVVFWNVKVRAQVAFKSMPIVTTPFGNIYGKYQHSDSTSSVAAFLGVPYAKPPLGSLRYRKPVSITNGITPIYALTNKPACMQDSGVPIPWGDLESGKSEDCLYLNIWVPQSTVPMRLMAVMFYIHGGSFYIGSNRLDVYDGRVLAALGEVIVVTVNYRLGSFGFLNLDPPDTPGNVGVYDVAEALKWVNENIYYFGGDKDSITLFGQSAGAAISGAFAVSHLTRSLFKRMIVQSGPPTTIILLNGFVHNLNRTLAIAKQVGCASLENPASTDSQDIVECLRGMDANQLASADAIVNTPSLPNYKYQYGDDIFPINPLDSILEGDIKDCEVLIGVTKDEGANLLTFTFPDYFGPFGEKTSRLSKHRGEQMFKAMFPYIRDAGDIIDYYYADVHDDDYENIAIQTHKAVGDTALLCPSVYFAEIMADRNDVYYYTFEHRPSVAPYAEWLGVPHFDEVAFVYGQPLREPEKYHDSELMLSQEMVKIWSSFAKTGKPESSFGNWPLYSRHSPKYMVLNTTIDYQSEYGLEEERCNFLRTTYKIP